MQIKIKIPDYLVQAIKGIAKNTPDHIIKESFEIGFYTSVINNAKGGVAEDAAVKWFSELDIENRSKKLLKTVLELAVKNE